MVLLIEPQKKKQGIVRNNILLRRMAWGMMQLAHRNLLNSPLKCQGEHITKYAGLASNNQ